MKLGKWKVKLRSRNRRSSSWTGKLFSAYISSTDLSLTTKLRTRGWRLRWFFLVWNISAKVRGWQQFFFYLVTCCYSYCKIRAEPLCDLLEFPFYFSPFWAGSTFPSTRYLNPLENIRSDTENFTWVINIRPSFRYFTQSRALPGVNLSETLSGPTAISRILGLFLLQPSRLWL